MVYNFCLTEIKVLSFTKLLIGPLSVYCFPKRIVRCNLKLKFNFHYLSKIFFPFLMSGWCPSTKFYFTLSLSTDSTVVFKELMMDVNCVTATLFYFN